MAEMQHVRGYLIECVKVLCKSDFFFIWEGWSYTVIVSSGFQTTKSASIPTAIDPLQ